MGYSNVERINILTGLGVGDAFGAPYEFQSEANVQQLLRDEPARLSQFFPGGLHQVQPGEWTDDLALALAQYVAVMRQDEQPRYSDANFYYQLAEMRYRGKYFMRGECFDIGNSTASALFFYPRRSPEWREAGGNNTLIRQVALSLAGIPAEQAARAAQFTSGHPRALAVTAELGDLLDMCADQSPERRRETVEDFVESASPAQFKAGGGSAWDTLASACHAVRHASSFLNALEEAIRMGGDTDSVAALTGALWVLAYGLPSTPQEGNKLVTQFAEGRKAIQSVVEDPFTAFQPKVINPMIDL